MIENGRMFREDLAFLGNQLILEEVLVEGIELHMPVRVDAESKDSRSGHGSR